MAGSMTIVPNFAEAPGEDECLRPSLPPAQPSSPRFAIREA